MSTNLLIVVSVGLAIIVIALLLLILHFTRRRVKNGNGTIAGLDSKLRDETQKFAVIINSIEDGVVLVNSQRVINLFNPGAGNITGWDIKDAEGIDVGAVLKLVDGKGEPYPDHNNPFQKAFTQGQTVHDNNVFLLTRSNKQVPVSLNVTPLLDEVRHVTAVVAVFRNVTEERAEEQRRADFISTASHEMRTPVAAIEGYLALALNSKVATIDGRAKEYLEKAHLSAQHLGQLFQDLLTSSKAEDGRLSSHPVVVEMGGFLEQLTNDLKFAAEKKQLFTEFVVGSSQVINAHRDAEENTGERIVRPLYYAFADPDRLREVVTNLFDNAVKYTDQGKVTIGLTGDDQVVQFYVRDTGPGIPAEDVPHLFQKFYRVDNSATRTIGGTGLGLFISRKIVELYSGRIWVESQLGQGSCFFINLPRLSAQQANELMAKNPNPTTAEPVSTVPTS